MAAWPEHARHKVFTRDHGVCGSCGLDTVALSKSVLLSRYDPAVQRRGSNLILDGREVPIYRHLWETHHIKAFVEGGGVCGLDNYRTLCIWCHKAETADLLKRRSRDRNPQKGLPF